MSSGNTGEGGESISLDSILNDSSASKSSDTTERYFSMSRIKLITFVVIIFFVINSESFIHHILRKIPGAVRANENIPTGSGTIAQGIILMILYVAADMLVTNDMLI